jgi:hypothetical protein
MMMAQIAIRRSGFVTLGTPDLKQALRPAPGYERAVREVSRMLAAAGIRHAPAGALAANAYRNRPRTTEDICFLVGEEALEAHAGGFVTLRVPVSEGVPIAPLDTIVVMKLLAGRTQDLADIEAIISSGADRESLRPARAATRARSYASARAAVRQCRPHSLSDDQTSRIVDPGRV